MNKNIFTESIIRDVKIFREFYRPFFYIKGRNQFYKLIDIRFDMLQVKKLDKEEFIANK